LHEHATMLCYVYIIHLIALCGKLKIFPTSRTYVWNTKKFLPLKYAPLLCFYSSGVSNVSFQILLKKYHWIGSVHTMVEILMTQKHCCCTLWTLWKEIRYMRGLCCLYRSVSINFWTRWLSQNRVVRILSLAYIVKVQQDATITSLYFIFYGNIPLHVSDAFCIHHQEYIKLYLQPLVQVMCLGDLRGKIC
jgi:hypothetical protein